MKSLCVLLKNCGAFEVGKVSSSYAKVYVAIPSSWGTWLWHTLLSRAQEKEMQLWLCSWQSRNSTDMNKGIPEVPALESMAKYNLGSGINKA
jgi:NADH:ubiquinone oxidoreductase subunit